MSARGRLPEGWRWIKLGSICREDRRTVLPDSRQAAELPYLGLEHIESQSGRIIRDLGNKAEDVVQSNAFAFTPEHVLYGKLRPYLNKVALPTYPGRCTTELIPILPSPQVDRSFLAWLLRRSETVEAAMRGVTGSRMPRANMKELFAMPVPLPPLPEQRRIVAKLAERLATVERARAAARAQLDAARALPAAYLRAVFEGEEARGWEHTTLSDLCVLLPARSIALDGNTEVQAITSACLSEIGFRAEGIKPGRMWARDVPECVVSAGEILIARSNTTELVGRVAQYEGEPEGIVASDLTIRIWPSSELVNPQFLTFFLSFLFLAGYWRERAGGTSQSMKKIRRGQILNLGIPLPTFEKQVETALLSRFRLHQSMQVISILSQQIEQIEAMPAAYLQQAFSGAL